MREPPPTSCETMLATCKVRGALRPAADRAATAMAVTTTTTTPPTTPPTSRSGLPTVEFNLADFASHDEQGYHVWRFDDSRRWGRRRYGEPARSIVARRFPEQGHKHVSINRGFSNDELPHRIAFLISVYWTSRRSRSVPQRRRRPNDSSNDASAGQRVRPGRARGPVVRAPGRARTPNPGGPGCRTSTRA